MFLPLLLLPKNGTKILICLFTANILTNIFGIFVNIWVQKITSKFSELHQVIIGKILPCHLYYIPELSLENIYPRYQLRPIYFFAVSHDQKVQQFHKMSHVKQQEILANIKLDYQEIIINYFISDKNLPEKLDKFINTLFYANIPVPQIIEMHMEVIDEFAKQLRLEGRSDEALLDYRLTLIDILANLCEVYRCSLAKPH